MATTEIGGFHEVEEIGHGGMAVVYRAVEPKNRQIVAIKLMSVELSGDSGFRKRFQREADVLQRLRHPAIVPILGHGEHRGQPYLVMPYLSGGSLADRLKGGARPPGEVALLARIAGALDSAHRQSIIHRDVKSTNILFDAAGRPYLTDFGIVKLLDEAGTAVTQTGASLGTPGYMSPEQVRAQPLDGRCDVYALGVVLFEMLTGRLPYIATNPYAQAFQHVSEPIPEVRTFNPALAAGWQPIIERALAKERESRYATAWAVIQDAGNLIDLSAPVPLPGATTPARPPAPSPAALPSVTSARLTPPNADFYSQLSGLQWAMARAFSQNELKDIAFALGVIDFASLPGETKEDKVRELIGRMVREDRLSQLLALCRRERPTVAWPFVEQDGLLVPPVSPLDALFQQGILHQLQGELVDARQVFEGIQRIDPNFPGVQRKLAEIRYELGRGYVDSGGRVVPDRVLYPPALPRRNEGGTAARWLAVSVLLLMLVAGLLTLGILVARPLVTARPPAIVTTIPIAPPPATATPGLPAFRLARNAELRGGPGDDYPLVGQMAAGVLVTVVGQDAAGAWYNVQLGDGRGWLPRDAGELVDEADRTRIPVAGTIPATATVATATATNTATPTATPTATRTPLSTPTPTPTATATQRPPTATSTAVPPTETPTITPEPPQPRATDTLTPEPLPTDTPTPDVPELTATPTPEF